ncbi:MAG: hypothetical protein BroJett018_33620 [Chloroflexota bacterium]|nr:MAG: hypothetical protein BroJett018_33620 [Chloroflexota bacterium]
MTDMELIDDDSGWGVSANFLDDGKTFAGVTLYQFSDNQLVAVSELYTDAAEPAWLPTDLEMVGDRGWLGVITNVSAGESGAGRLIRVEAGSLSEVNVRAPQSTVVMGIDLLDADNGWAVGGVYDKDSNSVEMPRLTPVILKMENGSWFAVEAPMGDYFLMDVEMIAPNEAWAVGASGDINLGNTPNDVTGVFLHYLDGVWTVAQDFPQMAAADIEFFDQANGWAVGANENDTVAMFRFQNGVWELAPVVMPADYDVHISGADLYSNFELTGRDSGLVSSLYPEIMLPDRTNPSLLQLQSGSQWQGVVLPNIQSGFSFGTFVAVSPSRNRVIAGLIDTCMSGYCLVTYELEEDGTWRELSIYP